MKGEARNVWYLNNFWGLLYLFTIFTLIHPSATQYYELLFVIYFVLLPSYLDPPLRPDTQATKGLNHKIWNGREAERSGTTGAKDQEMALGRGWRASRYHERKFSICTDFPSSIYVVSSRLTSPGSPGMRPTGRVRDQFYLDFQVFNARCISTEDILLVSKSFGVWKF